MNLYLNAINCHVKSGSTSEFLLEASISPLDVSEERVDREDVTDRLLVQFFTKFDVRRKKPETF